MRQKRAQFGAVGLALQLGGTVVGSLLLFLGGGIWLDKRFGTQPLLLLIGLALAFIAIGYNLYEVAVLSTPRRDPAAPAKGTAPPRKSWDDWDREERAERGEQDADKPDISR